MRRIPASGPVVGGLYGVLYVNVYEILKSKALQNRGSSAKWHRTENPPRQAPQTGHTITTNIPLVENRVSYIGQN